MKHTIIAGCLLIIVLLVVVINAAFVRDITDELYTMLQGLPVSKSGFEENGGDGVKSFYMLWSEKRASLSISINEDELDRIDEAAAEMYGAAQSGDFTTYCAARERLLAFIPTLADGEKATFLKIF